MARAGASGTEGSAAFGLCVCSTNDLVHVLRRFKESDGELERDSRRRVEEAEVADLHKALGEHVLEKTPDERERLEAHVLLDSALGVGVGEGDRVFAYAHDAFVGDGGAKDIGGEVAHRPDTRSHRTGVYVPVLLERTGRDLFEEACFLDEIEEARKNA